MQFNSYYTEDDMRSVDKELAECIHGFRICTHNTANE